MTPQDILAEAMRALAVHRLRASLSSIGTVFGVATIIAALAIADGASREAFDEIDALGINNVLVRATRPSDIGLHARGWAPELTATDARMLAALPHVAAVASQRTARVEISSGRRQLTATLAGITPNWTRITRRRVANGRWLLDDDVTERRRVAVVGAALARQLFPDGDAVGRRVLAAGQWFRIVGVLEPLPTPTRQERALGAGGRASIARIDPVTSVFVPITTMDVKLGEGDETNRVEEIAVAATDADRVKPLAARVDALMRQRHPARGSWELVVPRELLDARLRAERVFNVVLMGVGGLALLISGIGIMNIMLASVTERAQEIGVRRAFGARIRDVIAQFAVEAILLAAGGGLVGVPIGALLASIVAAFAGWPITLSAGSIAIALAVAVVTGLFFGVYPARVAARVQPIDALRAPGASC